MTRVGGRRALVVGFAALLVLSGMVGGIGSVGAISDGDLTGVTIAYYDTSFTSNYNTLRADLEDRGATVIVVSSLSSETLADVDVLWLDDGGFDTSAADRDVVRDRLADGMAVMIHADENHLALVDSLDGLSVTGESTSGDPTDITAHPTTAGVSSLTEISSLDTVETSGNAVSLVRTADGATVAAVTTHDSGRVAWMDDNVGGAASEGTEGDNRLFINQVFDWLAVSGGGSSSPSGGSAQYEITDRSVGTRSVQLGEPVVVAFTVRNVGDETGTYTALVTADGDRVHSESVKLAPSGSARVSFEHTFDEPGSYQLWVRNRYVGRVTVERPAPAPAPLGDPSNLVIRHAYLTQGATEPGTPYSVVAVVQNAGEEATYGLTYVENVANGANSTRNETMHFGAGETKVVEMNAIAPETGTVSWKLNGVPLGEVTVSADEVGVVHAYTTQSSIGMGEQYDVIAVVHNAGTTGALLVLRYDAVPAEGSDTLEASTLQNGRVRFIWLSAGQTRTITYTATGEQAGNYTWTVSDAATNTSAAAEQISVIG
jgi:hypothetical protein